MDDLPDLLHRTASAVAEFRATLPERPVGPPADLVALRTALGGPLTAEPVPPGQVIEELIRAADPGLVATAGPRFFGFVIGGSLPAATAADMLAAGWDQVAFNAASSPAAAVTEEVAGGWLKQLLGISNTAITTTPAARIEYVIGSGRRSSIAAHCLAALGGACWSNRTTSDGSPFAAAQLATSRWIARLARRLAL